MRLLALFTRTRSRSANQRVLSRFAALCDGLDPDRRAPASVFRRASGLDLAGRRNATFAA